jgi:hypothetical protein
MKYSVRWLPAAEQELAALWMAADRRAAVTQAANLIDQDLSKSPKSIGESRPEDRRIYFVSPLAVLFRVSTEDRLVQVVHVWAFD